MRRARALVALLAAGLLVGAACGRDDDPATSPSVDATAPATAVGARRALVLGDSVAFDAAPAVAAALRAAGFTVREEPRLGLGLLRTDLVDWRVEWPRLVGEAAPAVVVLLVGAWDLPGGVPGAPAQPADWRGAYERAVADALDVVGARGARVAWIGLPWVRDVDPARVALLTEVQRTRVAATDRAVWVDGASVLAGPDGRFARTVAGATGEVVLRKLDGVHLCPAGAERLAAAVLAALDLEAPDLDAEPWQAGDWRRDTRYSPREGCPSAP